MSGAPSDLAIAVALVGDAREGWVYADEVRGVLVRLGFELSAQQCAQRMRRMARQTLPVVEVRTAPWGPDTMRQYRLTRAGAVLLWNQLHVRPRYAGDAG